MYNYVDNLVTHAGTVYATRTRLYAHAPVRARVGMPI